MSRRTPSALALLTAAAAAAAAFAALAIAVHAGGAPWWDRSLFREIYSGETTGPPGAAPNGSAILEVALPLLNRVGYGPLILLPIFVAAATLLAKRHFRAAAFCAAAVSIVMLSGQLKELFARSAPFESHGGVSFPSGHAIASMTSALAIAAVLAPTRARWPTVVLSALFAGAVGVSVIADGGHWPSDVLGGWMLAAAWVCGLAVVFRIRLTRTSG